MTTTELEPATAEADVITDARTALLAYRRLAELAKPEMEWRDVHALWDRRFDKVLMSLTGRMAYRAKYGPKAKIRGIIRGGSGPQESIKVFVACPGNPPPEATLEFVRALERYLRAEMRKDRSWDGKAWLTDVEIGSFWSVFTFNNCVAGAAIAAALIGIAQLGVGIASIPERAPAPDSAEATHAAGRKLLSDTRGHYIVIDHKGQQTVILGDRDPDRERTEAVRLVTDITGTIVTRIGDEYVVNMPGRGNVFVVADGGHAPLVPGKHYLFTGEWNEERLIIETATPSEEE